MFKPTDIKIALEMTFNMPGDVRQEIMECAKRTHAMGQHCIVAMSKDCYGRVALQEITCSKKQAREFGVEDAENTVIAFFLLSTDRREVLSINGMDMKNLDTWCNASNCSTVVVIPTNNPSCLYN